MDIKKTDLVQQVLSMGKKKIAPTNETSKDSLNISSYGKQLSEVNIYKKIVLSAPQVREDRIKEVKERLENGFYMNDKINKLLSEKLANFLQNEDI
jgi:anti-sigma28 factor (negative regulator of flagellin synthesis)